jgi:uncharacterized protein
MLLSIKEMEVRDLPFDHAWQPGEIDFTDSGTVQRGPLSARGIAVMLPDTGGEVRVRGHATADLESVCDRCLGTAAFHVDAAFDLFYEPAEAASKAEETAIDEGEAEIGYYEMPGLVLEDILREQILLQLPMQRVCREDCKGICPTCGGNRNETECHCEEVQPVAHPDDDRWKGLRSIQLPVKPSFK